MSLMRPRRSRVPLIKRIAYRLGMRPHPGSWLYSPSLSALSVSAGVAQAVAAELKRPSVIGSIYANPVHEGMPDEIVRFPLHVTRDSDRDVDQQSLGIAIFRFQVSRCPHVDIEYRADGYVCRSCGLGVTRDSRRDTRETGDDHTTLSPEPPDTCWCGRPIHPGSVWIKP